MDIHKIPMIAKDELEKPIGERNNAHNAYAYLCAQIDRSLQLANSDYLSGSHDLLNLLLEETRLEYTKLKYDPTGVLNYYANRQEVSDKFTDRRFNLSSTNYLIPYNEEEDTTKHLILHTLPSLILLNSQEGHNGGNNALSHMGSILTSSQKVINQPGATTYHMRGADFITYMDAQPAAVTSYINTYKNEHWPAIKGTTEHPYILEETTTLAECIEIFNNIQLLRKNISPEMMITEQRQVQEEVLKIGETILTYKLEFKKAQYMLTQFWNIYKQGLPEHNEYLTHFLNVYLKPYLYSLNITSLEDFANYVNGGPEFAIIELAWRRASNCLGKREDPTRGMAIQNYIESKLGAPTFKEADMPLPKTTTWDEISNFSAIDFVSNNYKFRQINPKDISISNIQPKPPRVEDTQSYKQFYYLHQEISDLLRASRINGISIEGFWQLIHLSGLEKEKQIGEFKINPGQELYNQIFREEAPDREEKFLNLIEQLFINRYLGMDQMTLHPNRETLYKSSHEQIKKALMSYEDISMTSLDLGFVNYYNQEGCRNTGNLAILYAFNLLNTTLNVIDNTEQAQAPEQLIDIAINNIENNAVKQGKKNMIVYRYAGDELAFMYSGDTDKLRKALKHINNRGKVVPPASTASPGYIPLRLQFNYGITSIFEAEEQLEAYLENETTSNIFSVVQLELIKQLSNTRAPLRVIKAIKQVDIKKCISDHTYQKKMQETLKFLNNYVYNDEQTYSISLIEKYIEEGAINWSDAASVSHAFNQINILIDDHIIADIESRVSEQLSEFKGKTFDTYAKQLLDIMIKTSDEASLAEKVQSRFELLFEHYENLPDLSDSESNEYRALLCLITYSSKALKTMSVSLLGEIAQKYSQDNTKTPWEHYQEYLLKL